MLLVVGLGNPGKEYSNNRHNVGFLAVDKITRQYHFSSFRSKFQGQLAQGKIDNRRVMALKPSTFMNESGRSVQAVMDFYKIPPNNIIVIHDEIDLLSGRVRVKKGGGHAGHNGLRSIHNHVGPDFVRVRIGIGHPGDKFKVASYVLKDFSKSEQNLVNRVVDAIGNFIPMVAGGDYSTFMSKVAAVHITQRTKIPSSEVIELEENKPEKKFN